MCWELADVGISDAQDTVVDPYGWQGSGDPVWANNQVNSLWLQNPSVGTNPAILPRGTVLPIPPIPRWRRVVDDSQATFQNGANCAWEPRTVAAAYNGQMRQILPIANGTAACWVRWPRPALSSGTYHLYATVPAGFVTALDAAEAAVYTIRREVWPDPPIYEDNQALVSQRDTLEGNALNGGHVYLGAYYFRGGEADEFISLSYVISGVVTANTRLGADAILFVPGNAMDSYIPYAVRGYGGSPPNTATPTPSPIPTATHTPTPIPLTRTPTPSRTVTRTPTPPLSPTRTATRTATRTPTPTVTLTPLPTNCVPLPCPGVGGPGRP